MKPSKRNIRNELAKREKLAAGKPKVSKYQAKRGVVLQGRNGRVLGGVKIAREEGN